MITYTIHDARDNGIDEDGVIIYLIKNGKTLSSLLVENDDNVDEIARAFKDGYIFGFYECLKRIRTKTKDILSDLEKMEI